MRLHFVSRDDAFAGHPWLARHVMDWQRCALDPASDRYEPGDQVFLDLDGEDATVLTKALASQLNREHEAQLAALRDDFRGPLRDGKSIAFTVAEPPGATPEQSAAMAGPALSDLCRALGCDEVAILPMTRRPILVQRNKASETAHETLQALGLKPDFDGAMIGAPDDIAPFVGPLFRIARCNASAPYIAFGMKGLAVAGAFCKHVNFHFDSYDRGDADRLSHALAGCGFAVPDDGICSERFSETGAIEGRRLDLNP